MSKLKMLGKDPKTTNNTSYTVNTENLEGEEYDWYRALNDPKKWRKMDFFDNFK